MRGVVSAGMVSALGDRIEFSIVTSDRDAGDTSPYPDVPIDRWHGVGRASVFYASPAQRSPHAASAKN